MWPAGVIGRRKRLKISGGNSCGFESRDLYHLRRANPKDCWLPDATSKVVGRHRRASSNLALSAKKEAYLRVGRAVSLTVRIVRVFKLATQQIDKIMKIENDKRCCDDRVKDNLKKE